MSNRERYIRRRALQLGLDPDAVVAISMHECPTCLRGGSAVGDGGHAFGPFQMNDAGGVLTGRPGDHKAFAESNAGIDFALRGMVKAGAKGLKGRAAVEAIARRYERPADPEAEIEDAMRHYGHVGAPGGPLRGATQAGHDVSSMLSSQAFKSMAASALLQQASSTASGRLGDPSGLMALAVARKQFEAAHDTYGPQPTKAGLTGKTTHGPVQFIGDTHGENPAFLSKLGQAAAAVGGTKIRVRSGYRSPEHNRAVGGVAHSNHMYGHAMDGEVFIPGKGWVPLGVALQGVAGKYGLRSGNVPGFYRGGLDPVHVDDGFNQR